MKVVGSVDKFSPYGCERQRVRYLCSVCVPNFETVEIPVRLYRQNEA